MRHSVRARFLQALVCAGGMLALPAPALAAGGSPVHVDPASPVAKEYALPLATARGAAPESGKSGSLFGSGIKHTGTTQRQTQTVSAPPPTDSQLPQPVTTATQPVATATQPVATATQPVATATAPVTAPTRPRHPRHVTTATPPSVRTPVTTRQATARATPAAYRVLRPGAGSGLLWMLVVASLVTALGSAGGMALKRRR